MPSDHDSSHLSFRCHLRALGLLGLTLLTSTIMMAVEPLFERSMSTGTACVYAEEATTQESTTQEYKLPKELKMPKLTPEMKKFIEEYGVLQYFNVKENLPYNIFIRNKTTDGLYERIYENENQEFKQLRGEVLRSLMDSPHPEINEGIKSFVSPNEIRVKLLTEYADRVWKELFVNLIAALTEVERPQLIEQQKRLLTAHHIDLVLFKNATSETLKVADVSAGDFRFVDMTIGGDVCERYKFMRAGISMLLTKTLKGNPNPIVALVSFPQDPSEKRTDPVRIYFLEYVNESAVAQDVSNKFIANLWPRALKELENQFIMPSSKWVVQSTNPPVIIKDPNGKGRKAILTLSDDPELVKLLHDRGITPKEPAKPKSQSD